MRIRNPVLVLRHCVWRSPTGYLDDAFDHRRREQRALLHPIDGARVRDEAPFVDSNRIARSTEAIFVAATESGAIRLSVDMARVLQ